jgi:DnaJ-class molecular chaperone
MTENEENKYETAVCAHCDGIGCLYCDRTGCVLVASPKRKCLHCDGVGCIYCGFTGWANPKGKYD